MKNITKLEFILSVSKTFRKLNFFVIIALNLFNTYIFPCHIRAVPINHNIYMVTLNRQPKASELLYASICEMVYRTLNRTMTCLMFTKEKASKGFENAWRDMCGYNFMDGIYQQRPSLSLFDSCRAAKILSNLYWLLIKKCLVKHSNYDLKRLLLEIEETRNKIDFM